MIYKKQIQTERLNVSYLETGNPREETLMLLHGNVSSSAFFRPLMHKLPKNLHMIAPDLRGFGNSETAPVDATKGVKDFSEDLFSFLKKINLTDKKVHLLGWSAGGIIVLQFAHDHPELVASITLQAPMSPFGFGGTKNKGLEMEPCAIDFSGSGGGTASLRFIDCIRTRDGEIPSTQPEAAQCNVQSHARATMNAFYFKMIDGKTLFQRNIIDKATEDLFTESMYTTKLGEHNYPGNLVASNNWPMLAPGDCGMNNAISPKHCNLSNFATAKTTAPVLWIRGEDDQIVSDTSMLELNYLGSLGYVPDWPGMATHPPQPMVTQMRVVLDAYSKNGGTYKELVFKDCGHSPHIEQEEKFIDALLNFIGKID